MVEQLQREMDGFGVEVSSCGLGMMVRLVA
jgi:hypothetical protein